MSSGATWIYRVLVLGLERGLTSGVEGPGFRRVSAKLKSCSDCCDYICYSFTVTLTLVDDVTMAFIIVAKTP